jgi:hypothetical protein
MINYTDRVRLLMADIVSRVPALSEIDMRSVVVFARHGRSSTHGAYATCHSLMLPDSEPAYYYWRDRRTGHLRRRSEWFVMRSPAVQVDGARVSHLISIALPRFCDQTLVGSRKERTYPRGADWLAKLDTIVHELYHIDPRSGGIRQGVRADGRPAVVTHTPQFFKDVTRIVGDYLASGPDPAMYDFLGANFETLRRQHGGMVGVTFRGYPSFPQRFRERLAEQPGTPRVLQVVALNTTRHRDRFDDEDLVMRQFLPDSTGLVEASARRSVRGVHPRVGVSEAAQRGRR